MIEKLVALGSNALQAKQDVTASETWSAFGGDQGQALLGLLRLKNGFYAFESALHVFPISMGDCFKRQDLVRWNERETWKYAYAEDSDGLLAFAEDVFGCQFCIRAGKIVRFDPETGEAEPVCGSVEEWAGLICEDFEVQTGYQIAHEWQKLKGPLRPGSRLVPIYPLVTSQGSYELSNFYEVDATKGMLSRADFARQIKGVSDGSQIRVVPTHSN